MSQAISRTKLFGTTSTSRTPAWAKLKDQELLDLRICDLELEFEDTPLVELRDQLHCELAERDLKLKPQVWLSDDWFSPDGTPGIAVPFYMAHPRLMRLERKQMLEVEGGTKRWCMRILRHEAGHAIDTAFRLHRRKTYKRIFGNYHDPYPDSYRPKPRSKNFVLHLEPWYAQSHPAEDFAETFAVWLNPRSRWKQEYKGWAAIKKVQFVDDLMNRIAGQTPKLTSRAKIDPVSRIKKTLREHYAERHARYNVDSPSAFDDALKKMFPPTPKDRGTKSAAAFLQKNRSQFSLAIAQWTDEYRYTIDQVLREMIDRCRTMKLSVEVDADGNLANETELRQNLLIMITVHTMNYLRGSQRVAL
jgi:hypothetical protein